MKGSCRAAGDGEMQHGFLLPPASWWVRNYVRDCEVTNSRNAQKQVHFNCSSFRDSETELNTFLLSQNLEFIHRTCQHKCLVTEGSGTSAGGRGRSGWLVSPVHPSEPVSVSKAWVLGVLFPSSVRYEGEVLHRTHRAWSAAAGDRPERPKSFSGQFQLEHFKL